MKKKKLLVEVSFWRGEAEDLGSYSLRGKVNLNTGIITLLEEKEKSCDTVSGIVLKCNSQRLYQQLIDPKVLQINLKDVIHN